MGKVNHITMLVTGEQEDAIRSLFKDKNWPCWLKVLTNENVAGLIEGGFTYIFPSMEMDNTSTEIKLEFMDVDCNDDGWFINVSNDIPNCTVGNDDVMNNAMVQKKSVLDLNNNKTENTQADATEETGGNVSTQIRDDEQIENKLDKRNHCHLCKICCKTRKLLKKHFDNHHKGMWLEFECMNCPKNFKTKDELWEHRRNANHKLITGLSIDRTEFYTPEELLAMNYIQCEICSKFYSRRRNLNKHMKKEHEQNQALPKCTCDICGAVFDTGDAFWQHKMDTHHNQSDSCGQFFSANDSLEEQKVTCITDGSTAGELKNFPCDICGLVFKSMIRVKLHKRVVHVVAPFVCHECGVSFENKHALLKHGLCHDTKIRKCGRDDCGKIFSSNKSLLQHKRTHTTENPVQMFNA